MLKRASCITILWTIFLFKQKHHNLLNTFQKTSQPIEQRQIQAATSASSNMAVNSVSCSHRANLGVIDWDNMLKSKGWDFHVEKLENNVQWCHSHSSLFSIFTNIQLDVLGIPKVDLASFQSILRGFLSSYDVPNRCSKETFLWRCRPGHPR